MSGGPRGVVVCIGLRAASALLLGMLWALSPARAQTDDDELLWHRAHGLAANEGRCEPAVPLLRELLARSADGAEHRMYASMLLGRCLAKAGRFEEAAPLLEVTAGSTEPGHVLIRAEALRELARLYAEGLGVPADPDRAIGLYLRADAWLPAAELMERQGWGNGATRDLLLDHAGVAGKLHLAERMAMRNANEYDVQRKLLDALATSPDSEADRAALSTVALRLAAIESRRQGPGDLLSTLDLLRRTGPAGAGELQAAVSRIPFDVHLPGDPAPAASARPRAGQPWPTGVSPHLLAWAIWGETLFAEPLPIAAGAPGEWWLVAEAGTIDRRDLTWASVARGANVDPRYRVALVRVVSVPGAGRPRIDVLATSSAQGIGTDCLAGLVEEGSPSQAEILSPVRALRLGPHRVLVMEQAHPAGGGAFAATALLWPQDGRLNEVLCAVISNPSATAGGWLPDGSRLRPVHPRASQSGGQPVRSGWPVLGLFPKGATRPVVRWAWDPAQQRYEPIPGRRR